MREVQSPGAPLLVFSQAVQPAIDIEAWNTHAERFFATAVGIAEELQRGPASVGDGRLAAAAITEARIVVAPRGLEAAIRRVRMRSRLDGDLAAAEQADARHGPTGLALLARRCPTVCAIDRAHDDDMLAWRLAAIVASLTLGPILDTAAGILLGPKSARERFGLGLGLRHKARS
jgi:hypothetical protein